MVDDKQELNVEELQKGLKASMKMCRWVYANAIEEGFSASEALQFAIAYMTAIFSAAKK